MLAFKNATRRSGSLVATLYELTLQPLEQWLCCGVHGAHTDVKEEEEAVPSGTSNIQNLVHTAQGPSIRAQQVQVLRK